MDEDGNARETAVKRLKTKRDFRMHLGTYLIVSVFFVVIWAMGPRAGFWPAWPMLVWGIAVAFHGWWTYFGNSISESDIRREMGRR